MGSVAVDLPQRQVELELASPIGTEQASKTHDHGANPCQPVWILEVDGIHQDKALTKQIIGRYSQTTADDVLEDSYLSALPAIPRVPLPTRAAIEVALELAEHSNPAAAHADPSEFFDPRFVQELEDSGYIRGLYR